MISIKNINFRYTFIIHISVCYRNPIISLCVHVYGTGFYYEPEVGDFLNEQLYQNYLWNRPTSPIFRYGTFKLLRPSRRQKTKHPHDAWRILAYIHVIYKIVFCFFGRTWYALIILMCICMYLLYVINGNSP